jgi:hypothetical protein
MDNNNHWSIQQFWNDTALPNNSWPAKPRDYVYATEIGAPLIEVFWKLKGEPVTNDFSDLIVRKMEAGNFMENLIVWVFKRCGILKEWQGTVRFEDAKYLPVHGRLDVVAGHDGNWEETIKKVEQFYETMDQAWLDFPYYSIAKEKSKILLRGLAEQYPNGLTDKIYEIKSLNSHAFWKSNGERIGTPYDRHRKQLGLYQMVKNLPGSFLYIDRDTMAISEIPNILTDELQKEILDWLEKITFYYKNNTEPPLPELIVWEEDKRQWAFNWEVERSVYRDKIIGGADKIDGILAAVKQKNIVQKEKEKIDMLMQKQDFRGAKKYAEIEKALRNPLIDKSDLSDQYGISVEALEYWEKTYPELPNTKKDTFSL